MRVKFRFAYHRVFCISFRVFCISYRAAPPACTHFPAWARAAAPVHVGGSASLHPSSCVPPRWAHGSLPRTAQVHYCSPALRSPPLPLLCLQPVPSTGPTRCIRGERKCIFAAPLSLKANMPRVLPPLLESDALWIVSPRRGILPLHISYRNHSYYNDNFNVCQSSCPIPATIV